MQQITIIGNLGTDARVEDINGTNYAILEVAVSNGKDKPSIWYRVLRRLYGDGKLNDAWKRGAGVCVMGRLDASAYLSKKDNTAKVSLTIWADLTEVTKYVDSGAPAAPAYVPASAPQTKDIGAQVAAAAGDDLGDLPF